MNRFFHSISFVLMNSSRKLTLIGGFLLALSTLQAQVLIIPQVADGGGWQTEFVATNSAAAARLGRHASGAIQHHVDFAKQLLDHELELDYLYHARERTYDELDRIGIQPNHPARQ